MSVSKIFLFCCLSLVGAIAISSAVEVSQVSRLSVFISGIFLVSLFFAYGKVVAAGCMLLAAGFGFWLYDSAIQVSLNNELKAFYGQEVVFEAKVIREAERRVSNTRVRVQPGFVAYGNVLLFLKFPEELRYGDRIRVQGLLQEPKNFEDFDYASFLAKDGIYAVMFEPEVELAERAAYESAREYALGYIFAAKRRFQEVLHAHIGQPESQIASAILLGDKGGISPGVAEKLNKAGVRHITAISGMHVAIFTTQLMLLLLWVGLWRHHAFYATLSLMLLFVVLTGLQPSAVRAGIMGGMFLLGQHLGRQNFSLRALVFVAAGMLALNPLLLARDVGFQLSFLAVLGIILFLPIFQHLTRKLPEKLHNPRDLVGMTIAAQIFTLPILMFNFGFVSLATIATNLLIVPLLSGFMGFGYGFLAVGSLIPPIAFLLSLPVSLFLLYMDAVIEFFSSLRFAAVQTENLSVLWLIFLYIPVGYYYWKFRKRGDFLVQW